MDIVSFGNLDNFTSEVSSSSEFKDIRLYSCCFFVDVPSMKAGQVLVCGGLCSTYGQQVVGVAMKQAAS